MEAAKTILICEDEESLRELVRVALGTRYRYLEAANGDDGLELARRLRPDLLVLDLMLPGRSGLEILDALRADTELAGMPVVVVSAWSDAELDAMEAGADHFLAKPFDPDELNLTVERMLARREPGSG